MNNKIICIPTFTKIDTLQQTLKHICLADGSENYTVVIMVDSHKDMPYKNRSDWIIKNNNILEFLDTYIKKHSFKDLIIIKTPYNYGPYRSCFHLINYCIELSNYVIFLEDDVIIAKDALILYELMFDIQDKNNDIFAVSCSSMIKKLRSSAEKDIYLLSKASWIPSYEFGINKNIWKKYGYIRGNHPGGDVQFGDCCKKSGLYTIFPKVSRCCRIGQYHEDSYSSYYHKKIIDQYSTCLPDSDMFNIDFIKNKVYLDE